MSIKVLFKVLLKEDFLGLDKKIDLSFYFLSLAVKFRLGINLGGNIARVFWVKLEDLDKNVIIGELLDNPIDVNAENLFSGDLPIDQEKKHLNLVYESLFSRMSRVQNFFQMILNDENISSISVDIDALNTFDYQDFKKITINTDQFVNTMIRLFEDNDQETPTVRINFIK
ncbi:MAG: hypothetical protein ABIF12_00585 [bacterium]